MNEKEKNLAKEINRTYSLFGLYIHNELNFKEIDFNDEFQKNLFLQDLKNKDFDVQNTLKPLIKEYKKVLE